MAAYDAYCSAVIHLDRLRRNWGVLAAAASRAPRGGSWPTLMPVVKADAYGHGLVPVVKTLHSEGAGAFAVGSVREAVRLVKALPALRREGARVLPLLGIQNKREADQAVAHGLVPLLHRKEQIELLRARVPAGSTCNVAVKVDTGMSRLGFGQGDVPALFELLRASNGLTPSLLLSHLSSADDPEAEATTRGQAALFADMLAAFRRLWPDVAPSLSNSPGILLSGDVLRLPPDNVGRPGFTLYGGKPFAGSSLAHLGRDFLPVMEVKAPVLEVRELAAGAQVSYGGTFTAPRAMRVAVIGAGYSDGISRALSGRGCVCIRGRRAAVLGRVCMQMFMADVSGIADVAIGDSAYILGGEGVAAVTPEELAASWGTIPYEVFCALGGNRRAYSG